MNDVASTRLVTVKRPALGYSGPMTHEQFVDALEVLERTGWIRVHFKPEIETHAAAVERAIVPPTIPLFIQDGVALELGARVCFVSQPEEPAEVITLVDPSEFERVDDHTVRMKPKGEAMTEKSTTERVLEAVKAGASTATLVRDELEITLHAARKLVDELVADGLLVARGKARGRRIYVRGHEPKHVSVERTPTPRSSARERPVKRDTSPRIAHIVERLEATIMKLDREIAELEAQRDELTSKREEKRSLEAALALLTKEEPTS